MESPAPASASLQLITAEQRARQFLNEKQWRKARDELKPLVKKDRSRYLPLLILANVGLSREMMAKGQVSEAQQVLNYLASIATAGQLRAAEQDLDGGNRPGFAGDLSRLFRALSDSAALASEADKLHWADQLVLAFQAPPDDGSAAAHLAAELRAINEALLAGSMQQWDCLTQALRAVPHRSLFFHWSAFLKGMAAFHLGDKERAVRFFSSLPPQSVPGKASQAYLLLAGKGQVTQPVLEGACRILGCPGAGDVLLRADEQWKRSRHADSYTTCRDRLPGFPSQSHDWLGALSEFYFNAPHSMPSGARKAFLGLFDDIMAGRSCKNGVEEMLALRLFAIATDSRSEWEAFLRLQNRLYGPNPQLSSLVYTRLGQAMAQRELISYYGRTRFVNEAEALDCLQKAIDLDPNNLEAHLTLVRVYTELKRNAERYRLLDRMVVRFPEDKRVLVDAASGCIERRALVKALGYLRRARELDQLDPRIPELISTAQRNLAQTYYAQRRLDKARECFKQVSEFLTDKPDDLQRSRWTVQVRQALMERHWGDPERGDALLASARASCPDPVAFLLFSHFAQRLFQPGHAPTSPVWNELNAAVTAAPQLGKAVLLIRILDYWAQIHPTLTQEFEIRLVRRYVTAAAKKPFTREEARQVIELKSADSAWRNELSVLIKTVLRSDKLDPLFKVYEFVVGRMASGNGPSARVKLNEILAEAGRRGDEATAQKVRQLLKKLEGPPGSPFPPPFDPSGFDYDDDDDDEGFDEEDTVGFLNPFDGFSPERAAELCDVLDALSNMSESQIRDARRTRPKGMPAEIFDMLVDLAKNGPPLMPPSSDPKRAPSRPQGPESDQDNPNQLRFPLT